METPEATLRETLNESFDNATPEGAPALAPTAVPEGTPTPVTTPGGTPAPLTPTPVPEAVSTLKPPQSWKPDMRDRWASLPLEIQTEVLRREKEINTGLQSSSESRKFQEEFNKTSAPYQSYLAAHSNGNPLEAFGNYLKTATLLRTGSAHEKANALAAAVGEYGIDLAMLDAALSARLRGQPQQQQPQSPQFRDPRVDELIQARERETQTAISEEISTFAANPKHEFFADVKDDIADLLEFNASRNVKMTIQQAYDKACLMSPSVTAALEGRKTQTFAARQTQGLARARHAASGVAPGAAAPAAPISAKGKGTMSDDIRAAMDALQPE